MRILMIIRAFAFLIIGFSIWPALVSAEQSSPADAVDTVQTEATTEAGKSVDKESNAAAKVLPVEGISTKDSGTSSGNHSDTADQALQQASSSSAQNHWYATPGSYTNLFNPMEMMNPMMGMMNLMMGMMNPMMGMMNPMMGMMNPMINYPVDTMTHAQTMDMMMRSMNPHLIFGMFGQASQAYKEGQVPDRLPVVTIPGFPTQSDQNWPINKVSPGVSREAKKNAFQTAMAVSPLSMRDMISIMTDKIPVDEGVSWEDAVEAMKLRANEVNFKFVGSSRLWKEIEAVTGQPSAKVEMFRFCDAAVARKILDKIPEFIIFLPCQISLIEDGEGKLWIMTLDWSVEWLDFAQNTNSHWSKELREDAIRIREAIAYIMEGAATGDF